MTDEPTAAIERLVPCPLCGNGVVGLTEKEAASARATLEAARPTASGDASDAIERLERVTEVLRARVEYSGNRFALANEIDAAIATLSPKPVDPAKGDVVEALEAARLFIEQEYRDPAAEEHGEWLAEEARPIHAKLCNAVAAYLTAHPVLAALASNEQPALGQGGGA